MTLFARLHALARGKTGPLLLSAVTLLTVLAPVRENFSSKPVDSFPLSYFPMFSDRRTATFTGQTLFGVDAQGRRVRLPYRFAGSGGFNQVRRQIRAKVKDHQTDDLCRTIAGRLARRSRSAPAGVRFIQVATVTHHVDSFFAGDRNPAKEKIHSTCPVPEAVR